MPITERANMVGPTQLIRKATQQNGKVLPHESDPSKEPAKTTCGRKQDMKRRTVENLIRILIRSFPRTDELACASTEIHSKPISVRL
jgi:hypothetical protein